MMRQKSSEEIMAMSFKNYVERHQNTDFWVPCKTKNTTHHSKTNAKLKKKRTFLEVARKRVPQII